MHLRVHLLSRRRADAEVDKPDTRPAAAAFATWLLDLSAG